MRNFPDLTGVAVFAFIGFWVSIIGGLAFIVYGTYWLYQHLAWLP